MTQVEKSKNTEKRPIRKEKMIFEGGKFCLDIAKLIFGGVILAGIMRQEMNVTLLFAIGLTVVLIFVMLGFYLINKSN